MFDQVERTVESWKKDWPGPSWIRNIVSLCHHLLWLDTCFDLSRYPYLVNARTIYSMVKIPKWIMVNVTRDFIEQHHLIQWSRTTIWYFSLQWGKRLLDEPMTKKNKKGAFDRQTPETNLKYWFIATGDSHEWTKPAQYAASGPLFSVMVQYSWHWGTWKYTSQEIGHCHKNTALRLAVSHSGDCLCCKLSDHAWRLLWSTQK